jgi:hypothetical protein
VEGRDCQRGHRSSETSAEHLTLRPDVLRSFAPFFLPHSTPASPIEFCRYRLVLATLSISMGGLDRAIAALNVLGSVVQAVPVVGDGLKSATEIATKLCETVKVRAFFFSLIHPFEPLRRR